MKILITGVSGLLGINLAAEALKLRHEAIGAARARLPRAPFPTLAADLTRPDSVDEILDASQPDWVVNCAALANLDVCESDPAAARRLNAELPAQLAKACRERGLAFVHISTDAVFDGEKEGAYAEDDLPNPLGTYAKTKLEGEQAALSEYPRCLTARVNFYGWSLSGRRSLAEFFLEHLLQKKNVNGFTDVVFCPMLVNHTARVLLTMLEKNLSGLYHLVGTRAMSKYQFGVELARQFGLDERAVLPKSVKDSGLTARRSLNLRLSTAKVSAALGEPLPSFESGLSEFYAQYREGYPLRLREYRREAE